MYEQNIEEITEEIIKGRRLGREDDLSFLREGNLEQLKKGANATLTGDMLTTSGNNTKQDKAMLTDCGFDIQ